MKPIKYVGNSKKDIEDFSAKAKQRTLTALNVVSAELDLSPQEFKYMPTIGKGVYVLRLKVDKRYRVFYIAKFDEAIYVLHAFVKKTQKTSQNDIILGKSRFKALINERAGKNEREN